MILTYIFVSCFIFFAWIITVKVILRRPKKSIFAKERDNYFENMRELWIDEDEIIENYKAIKTFDELKSINSKINTVLKHEREQTRQSRRKKK